jgi:hypothetical protein
MTKKQGGLLLTGAYILIGFLIVRFIMNYTRTPEDTAGAIGLFGKDKEACTCQGVNIGYMTPRQCKRICKRAININK